MGEKKSIRSWAFYDWANSAFATTVMAGFFPLFFKAYWANLENPTESTFYLGIANSVGAVIVAVMAPFLGSIADRGSAKKKLLFIFACLGIVMSGSLYMVAQGFWQLAVLVYVLASVGFASGNIFYDSLLPEVSTRENVDKVSSLGFSLGYIGGGLLFLINVIMYLKPELFGISDSSTAIRLSFLSVAIWWLVFSIPIFLWVEEPKMYEPVSMRASVRLGWRQLTNTFNEIRHLKIVGIFLLAYWLYIDGVDTIIRMAVDYGISLNFSSESLIIALLIVQFTAWPFTMFYLKISSMTGTKNAILIAILGYSVITFFGYFMNQTWHFYVLAIMIGIFQGGIQALSRSLYTRIIPKEKSAEFFGFYNMMGKFAAVIGPAMMGTITYLTGNIRIGILSILLLFIAGFYFLRKVNVEEGEKMAREFLAK